MFSDSRCNRESRLRKPRDFLLDSPNLSIESSPQAEDAHFKLGSLRQQFVLGSYVVPHDGHRKSLFAFFPNSEDSTEPARPAR